MKNTDTKIFNGQVKEMAVAVEVFYLIIAAECERRDVFLVILKSQMYHGNKKLPHEKIEFRLSETM